MIIAYNFDKPNMWVATLDQFDPEKFMYYCPINPRTPVGQDFNVTTADLVSVLNRLNYGGNHELQCLTTMTARSLAVVAEHDFCDLSMLVYAGDNTPRCFNLTKSQDPYWSLHYFYHSYLPEKTNTVSQPVLLREPINGSGEFIWLFASTKNNVEKVLGEHIMNEVWFTIPSKTYEEWLKQPTAPFNTIGTQLLEKQPCTVNNDGSESIYDVFKK